MDLIHIFLQIQSLVPPFNMACEIGFLKIYINLKKLESGFNTLKIFHKNKQKSFLQILSSMPAVNTRSMCRSSFHQIHKVYLLISFPSSGKVPAINTYYHFNSH